MIRYAFSVIAFAALIPLFGWIAGMLPLDEPTPLVFAGYFAFWLAVFGACFMRVHRLVGQLRASVPVGSGKHGVMRKFLLTASVAFGAVLTYHWTTAACAAMPGIFGHACKEGVSPVVWVACVSFGILALLKATQLAPYAGRIMFRRMTW